MTVTPTVLRYSGLPPAVPFPFGPVGVGFTMLAGGAGVIVGWGVEETTNAATARVVIGDGSASQMSVPILPITLQAFESRSDFPPCGIVFERGAVAQVTAGTVAGVVHVVLLDPAELRQLLDASIPVAFG